MPEHIANQYRKAIEEHCPFGYIDRVALVGIATALEGLDLSDIVKLSRDTLVWIDGNPAFEASLKESWSYLSGEGAFGKVIFETMAKTA